MANIRWADAVDGLFGDAAGWLGDLVPNQFSNVFLVAAGPAFTVLAESGLLNQSDVVINSLQTSTNATLRIVGGEQVINDVLGITTNFTDTAGTGLGANLGKIIIQNSLTKNLLGTLTGASAIFNVNGVFDNVGNIEIAAENALLPVVGKAQAVFNVEKVLKLTGGGTMLLTSSLDNVIKGTTAASILYNVNNKIIGAGLLGDGNLTLVNEVAGLIDGSSRQVALIVDTGAKMITNNGVIEDTGLGGTVVKSSLLNNGTLLASLGKLAVDGPVSGTGIGKITKGGSLSFLSSFTQNVSFLAGGGTLALADPQAYLGKISGFSSLGSTALDLTNFSFGPQVSTIFKGTSLGGVLTVLDGGQSANFKLIGDYLNTAFTAVTDGAGGTKILGGGLLPTTATPTALITAMASFGAPAAGASSGAASVHPGPTPAMLVAPHVVAA
ncbi:MAG TPA: hypothetical protein VGH15_09935 [Caulobacteraceae bacterium]|jgi:hypothetical protein